MKKIIFLLCALLTTTSVWAEKMVMEVVPLGFRTMEEILPILRSLVPKPGAVTGMQNQLVIRTTSANLKEVKEVLAKLDHPPRRLMISVKRDRRENLWDYGADVTGSIGSGDVTLSSDKTTDQDQHGLILSGKTEGDHQANARVYGNRTQSDEVGVQKIQTLEGREAFIYTGQAVPLAESNLIISGAGATVHDTISYKNVTSGFYVMPRVHGDRVTLEIHPQSARLSRKGGGIIDVEDAQTVVSGRLGEWLMVGGTSGEETETGSGIIYSTRSGGDSNLAILLKVEEILD